MRDAGIRQIVANRRRRRQRFPDRLAKQPCPARPAVPVPRAAGRRPFADAVQGATRKAGNNLPRKRSDKRRNIGVAKHRNRRLAIVDLPGTYGLDPVSDVQVLTPMQRGPMGAIALNAAFERLPGLRMIDDTVDWLPSLWVRGARSLPVTW